MDEQDLLGRLIEQVIDGEALTSPYVVGITGSVAVGKSTFADAVATMLRSEGRNVEVVASDGFLMPNAVLEQRGLSMRKGYPESFDHEALAAFLDAAGRSTLGLAVPIYDHVRYDVVEGELHRLGEADIVVVEGLGLLDYPTVAALLDLSIYLHADVADIEGWYTHRFAEHTRRAVDEPGGFYDLFVGLDADQLRAAAEFTWTAVNLPNLLDHIAPTKGTADVVITKAADHTITSIERR